VKTPDPGNGAASGEPARDDVCDDGDKGRNARGVFSLAALPRPLQSFGRGVASPGHKSAAGTAGAAAANEQRLHQNGVGQAHPGSAPSESVHASTTVQEDGGPTESISEGEHATVAPEVTHVSTALAEGPDVRVAAPLEDNVAYSGSSEGPPTSPQISSAPSNEPTNARAKRGALVKRVAVPLGSDESGLVDLICDACMMRRQMERLGYDAGRAPLEGVSKDTVREGFTWLRALERELKKPAPDHACLGKLSRSFFDVVAAGQPTDRVSLDTLDEKVLVVELLSDIQAVYAKLLASAAGEGPRKALPAEEPTLSATERSYRMLACDLRLLAGDSSTSALIHEYVRTTQLAAPSGPQALRVLRVFAVDRHGEEARYAKHAEGANRMLLWHGAPLASWASVLSQGLRVALPAAPDAGFNFGKGLYFADMAGSAARRCRLDGASDRGLMLLAEVALGSCRELTQADPGAEASRILPKSSKCHSVLGRGLVSPGLTRARSLPDGVSVPLGPAVRREVPGGSLPYNEYVVYDTARVRMRYLVEFSYSDGPRCE